MISIFDTALLIQSECLFPLFHKNNAKTEKPNKSYIHIKVKLRVKYIKKSELSYYYMELCVTYRALLPSFVEIFYLWLIKIIIIIINSVCYNYFFSHTVF